MIHSKTDYLSYLAQDKEALNIGTEKYSFLKRLFFPNLIWLFEKRLRRCEYFLNVKKGGIQFFFAKILYRRISLKLGFSIPLNCFGAGLSIAHYGTIVINSKVKIGKNCRIHTSVNIGASAGEAKAPTLGDNVYIGPGAIIYGNIFIADNVTIAANSTVNKNCLESNVILAGSPAKIIKENMPVWWERNQLRLSKS